MKYYKLLADKILYYDICEIYIDEFKYIIN